MKRNTKAIGDVAEAAILAKFISLRYSVCQPFGDNQRYDLVVESKKTPGKFLRIQCKAAWLSADKNSVKFNVRSTITRSGIYLKSRDYKKDIDFFAAYCAVLNEVYLVPVDDAGISTFSMRLIPTKNAQKSGINSAKDYRI